MGFPAAHQPNIAAHSQPTHCARAEGICIGVPVFFATGSKWRGVMWAAVSGLTEPLGAVVGLIVLKAGAMDDTAMGIIMGLVRAGRHRGRVCRCCRCCLAQVPSGRPRLAARRP